MTDGKKSLTDPPNDLKEAIDWVLCMSGSDTPSNYHKGIQAIQALAQRIQSLLGTVRVGSVNVNTLFKGDLNKQSNQNAPILSLCLGLKHLLDQYNGMGRDYKCSYSDSDPSQTFNDEKYAKMFLGAIPLIFFGLGFLFYMCHQDGGRWSKRRLSVGPIKAFLESVGFSIEQLSGGKTCYDAVSSGLVMFSEFSYVDSLPKTFQDFLIEVEKKTKQTISNPNHVPLGALYLFAFKYLKTKTLITTSTTVSGIPKSDEEIATLLQKLGEAVKSLQVGQFDALSKAYTQLGAAITAALSVPDPSEESSVAGPVTGTVATAGLLGGGSAVYFNVGGAGTFFKGLFNFR
ncbi:variant erythrocyte surface antigen-1 family protein [Babesia caballi]|uniref:Variant erythrocyte surface antigen-1 family protein n=1 Tax=Babesia caballi TaxID=5871 RepID=A0AAV4LY14_BABCB|nr:variant erythrocyte surface antigen-1 family protein [Babesia caballi]